MCHSKYSHISCIQIQKNPKRFNKQKIWSNSSQKMFLSSDLSRSANSKLDLSRSAKSANLDLAKTAKKIATGCKKGHWRWNFYPQRWHTSWMASAYTMGVRSCLLCPQIWIEAKLCAPIWTEPVRTYLQQGNTSLQHSKRKTSYMAGTKNAIVCFTLTFTEQFQTTIYFAIHVIIQYFQCLHSHAQEYADIWIWSYAEAEATVM